MSDAAKTAADDAIALLLAHRSIRRFADAPVSDDDVRRAVEAGQAASTSSAVQAYCLIRVNDPKKRERLVELTGGQAKVAECGAFFIVAGDTRRHRLAVERAGGTYEAHLEAFLLAIIDATLFAQNLVVAFESMGYGICYIGGLRNQLDEVDALFEIPHGVLPIFGLCVGVPAESPSMRPRLPIDSVYFQDRYPDDQELYAQLDAYDATYRTYLEERGVEHAAERVWSSVMARKFGTAQRCDLADYYRKKGADLG